ncbi:MAG: shikimate kinase [Actinomyces urogenitalis]|uniref:shikimate kinase n=1 Tax=Actinomyces urogenitalis TaxID=103621 RepID=UPI002A8173D3|nr:shikimate kinase [Actinomyces urogenitalis]MDY3677776.1 shikimate kinase [Actinomyces urogenitalis]
MSGPQVGGEQAVAVILLGPPGSGCTSVGAALAAQRGGRSIDLAQRVAQHLGVAEASALVAVGEERYREVEAAVAVQTLQALEDGDVVALGSGCLGRAEVGAALAGARQRGARVVALTASVRRLAHRNGLDAPRSVALGNVNHVFTQMLHERDAQCQALADGVIDTTHTSAQEVAQALSSLPQGRDRLAGV